MRRIKYGRKFIVSPNLDFIKNISNTMFYLLNRVELLNMKPLKKNSVLNKEILRLSCHSKYIQCYHAASRSFKPGPPKIKSKPPKIVTSSKKSLEKLTFQICLIVSAFEHSLLFKI